MAKVQNTFLKSKMNKDLDARIVPNNEYREATNVQISRSENSEVGALENVLGNQSVLNFETLTEATGLKCIGQLPNELNNTVYLFLTNNTESLYAPTNKNYIVSYNPLTLQEAILVEGAFLNFSTLNPIYGVNILEGLLFWSDNRNQPRKIDVTLANRFYYTTEDQISVAKYNPYQCMELYQASTLASTSTVPYETTMKDVTSKALPNGGVGTVEGNGAAGTTTINIPAGGFKGDIVTGAPYDDAATIGYITSPSASITMIETGGVNATVVSNTYVVPTTPVGNPDPPYFTVVITGGNFPTIPSNASYDIVFNPNPYYNAQFPGDADYLEDKFVRFSYRFKFENNEYSIFAPFTQTTFIPKQDGYFMYLDELGLPKVDDQTNTYRSTVASFVENKVDDIRLRIPLPFKNYELADKLKITEIDILYRESDGLSVKVVDTITNQQILESSATCIVNGAVTASSTIVVDNIIGGIKAGDTVSGVGLNDVALTTFPATVSSFNSTTNTIVLSEAVTLQNDVVLTINDPEYFVYNYQSTKPFKTLPEFQTTRVYDKTPVRALAQEISGNRVIYGNYIDKHTPPAAIDYNVACTEKAEFSINEISVSSFQSYSNTNIIIVDVTNAKDRDFIVSGMIFTSDSIGAIIPDDTFISNVVLGPAGNQVTITLTNNVTISTGDIIILQPGGDVQNFTSRIEYPNHSVKTNRNYQVGFVLSDRYGRQSSVILSNNTEELTINNITYAGSTLYSPYIGEVVDPDEWAGNSLKLLVNNPITGASTGLYNGDTASLNYNPTGWYSYKIVVKQTEQDYYNVYLPGIMAAYPNDATLELGNTSHAVLINDNINKVPRDLNEVGPEQRQFRSSVQLFGRVENTSVSVTSPNVGDSNTQYYPGRSSDTVSTISTVNDLFDYNPISPDQPNYFPQFYDLNSNPLIARISTESKIGQISTTNYSPSSAVVEADVDNNFIIPITSTTGTPASNDLVSGQNIPDEVYIDTILAPAGADAKGITTDVVGGSPASGFLQVETAQLSGVITAGSIITGHADIPEGTTVVGYSTGDGLPANVLQCSEVITGVPQGTRLTFTAVPGKINLKSADGAAFRISVKAETVLSFSETTGSPDFDIDIPGIQYLAVYETEPVESLLDIFWETSTAGLISELNDAILNSSDAGGAFSGFNLNPFTEGLANGSAILQAPFQLTTNFGDVITGGALVLTSVTELLNGIPGIDVSNYFILDEPVTDFWTIKTTQVYYDTVFYFFDDQAEKRSFRFTFTSTVNSQENIIIEDAFLANEEPVITPTSLSTIYTNITVTTPLLPGVGLQGVNGANNTVLCRSDLNWSIFWVRQSLNSAANDVTSSNLFSLSTNNNTTTSTLDAQISNLVGTDMPSDVFYLRLLLEDAGGEDIIDIVIDFRLLIPSGNIFNSLTEGTCQGDTQPDYYPATYIVIDANVPGAIPSTYGRYYFTRGMFEDYGTNGYSLVSYSGGNLITLPLNAPDAAGNQAVQSGSGFNCPVWFFVAAPGTFNDLEDLVGDYECDCDFGSTINITTQGCQSNQCGTTIPQHPDVTGYAFQII
jgi:hypothetical protein